MKVNKMGAAGLVIFGLFWPGAGLLKPGTALGVGPDPTGGHGAPALDYLPFSDTNWLSHYGNAPLVASNLVNVPYLGDGNCLLLDSADAAWLQYSLTQNATNRL